MIFREKVPETFCSYGRYISKRYTVSLHMHNRAGDHLKCKVKACPRLGTE